MVPRMTRSPDTTTGERSLGWYADPFGRHGLRFHDGRRWTDHVADADERTIDPLSLATSVPGRDGHAAADPPEPSAPPQDATNTKAVLVIVAAVALLAVAVVVFRHRGDDATDAGDADQPAVPTVVGPGSADEPLALGGVATVGEWEVSVLAVDPDGATRVIEAGGPEAQAGYDFVIVHVRARNIGTEPAVLGDAAIVGYEGSDGSSYDDELGAVLPSALAGMAPIAPGDHAVGTVVLEVPVGAIADGRVFAESTLSLESARTWWRTS